MAKEKKLRLKVRRQDAGDRTETKRWEEYDVPWQPQMNVISALMEIQKDPVTTDGKQASPRWCGSAPAWRRSAARAR